MFSCFVFPRRTSIAINWLCFASVVRLSVLFLSPVACCWIISEASKLQPATHSHLTLDSSCTSFYRSRSENFASFDFFLWVASTTATSYHLSFTSLQPAYVSPSEERERDFSLAAGHTSSRTSCLIGKRQPTNRAISYQPDLGSQLRIRLLPSLAS